MTDRKLRALWIANNDGVRAYGARVGYWPCVGGPFFQITIGKKHLSIWIGTEYDSEQEPNEPADHKHQFLPWLTLPSGSSWTQCVSCDLPFQYDN